MKGLRWMAFGLQLWAALAITGLLCAAFIEIGLKIPLPAWAYAIVCGNSLLCFATAGWLFPAFKKRFLVAVVSYVGALFLLFSVPWSTRKPFLQKFHQIAVGITAQDVSRIMGAYTLRDESATLMQFRHSKDPRFDSDIGLVYLQNGKVVRTEFLFD